MAGRSDSTWEDKQIRFDVDDKNLECKPGEVVIDQLGHIEDSKGNKGDRGKMWITNLRVIWQSLEYRPCPNLSIGLNCIVNISQKVSQTRLRGRTESLFLLASNGTSEPRLEFIFMNLTPGKSRLFSSIRAIHKAYLSSKMYREVKLRTMLVSNGRLQLLRDEQIFESIDGAWNLSTDQGSLGTLVVTNVRVVWHAKNNATFNVSIPFCRLRSSRLRESRFGPALVLETKPCGGGYVLGFRIDPQSRLQAVQTEILSLWKIYKQNPIYGVYFERETAMGAPLSDGGDLAAAAAASPVTKQPGDLVTEATGDGDDDDEAYTSNDAYLAYFADGDRKDTVKPVVFSDELQLAVERLPQDVTLADLWDIQPKKGKKDKLREACGEKS